MCITLNEPFWSGSEYIYIVAQPSPPNIPRTLSPFPTETVLIKLKLPIYLSPQPLGTIALLSISMNLTPLSTGYNWNHTIYVLLWLTTPTQHYVFNGHLYCSTCQNFLRFKECLTFHWAFPVARKAKNLSAMQEIQVRSLGQKDPLDKEMANHSSILAGRIPWTEETGRSQLTGYKQLCMTEQLTLSLLTFHCLSVHLLKDNCFHLLVVAKMLLWTWMYKYQFKSLFSSPLCIYPEVDMLGHIVILHQILGGTDIICSTAAHQSTFSAVYKYPNFSASLVTCILFCFVCFIIAIQMSMNCELLFHH